MPSSKSRKRKSCCPCNYNNSPSSSPDSPIIGGPPIQRTSKPKTTASWKDRNTKRIHRQNKDREKEKALGAVSHFPLPPDMKKEIYNRAIIDRGNTRGGRKRKQSKSCCKKNNCKCKCCKTRRK